MAGEKNTGTGAEETNIFDYFLGGAGTGLLASAYGDLGKIGERGIALGTELAEEQLGQAEFRPYTITTGTGGRFGVTRDPATGQLATTMSYSPQEQALSQALFGQAGQMLGQPTPGSMQVQQAGMDVLGRGQGMIGQPVFGIDPTRAASTQAFGLGGQFMEQAGMPAFDREAALYERMRATQTPEEERQRLELEQRLAAQGRLGVSTAQYGGTPEQLAMAKAQEEAKSQAMLSAIGQARAEQAQQAALGAQYAGLGTTLAGQQQALSAGQQAQALQALQAGQGLLGGSQALMSGQQQLGMGALAGAYLPQQQLAAALSAGQTAAAQQQQAQLYGAGLFGEARASGIDMLLASALGQANLAGSLGTGLLGGALGGGYDIGLKKILDSL
jgi:hypothetical protein